MKLHWIIRGNMQQHPLKERQTLPWLFAAQAMTILTSLYFWLLDFDDITMLIYQAVLASQFLVLGHTIYGIAKRWHQFEGKNITRIGFAEFMDRMRSCQNLDRKRHASPQDATIWLGLGFRWSAAHTEKILRHDQLPFAYQNRLPTWVRRITRIRARRSPVAIGQGIFHGVESNEVDITYSLSQLNGGLGIVGTTQSGKGIVLTTLIRRAIVRGETVIVIDPKSSKRLRGAILHAAKEVGRDPVSEFHPAFPRRGVRLDPFGSFDRASELASRVISVLPEDTAGAFRSFAWQAVYNIVDGLLYLGERPSLKLLTEIMSQSIDNLLRRILVKAHRDYGLAELSIPASNRYNKAPPTHLEELIYSWETQNPNGREITLIASLIATHRHDRDHYAKITASLMPILTMLTSGHLAQTLSPDYEDMNDTRPIETLEQVVHRQGILYVGLDALPDATIAQALGAILLSDLTALTGHLYNEEKSGVDAPRISVFVDEAFNVINTPLLELLNKGMEAGVHVTLAMQTIPDLVERLGSTAKAKMVLGNLNHWLVLRTKDPETQRMIVKAFGESLQKNRSYAVSERTDTDDWAQFSASWSMTQNEVYSRNIRAQWLGALPNGEYFALLGGGELWKGRMPLVIDRLKTEHLPPFRIYEHGENS